MALSTALFMSISIRTPAWGVTRVFQHSGAMQSISIRTPAWGVTLGGKHK